MSSLVIYLYRKFSRRGTSRRDRDAVIAADEQLTTLTADDIAAVDA